MSTMNGYRFLPLLLLNWLTLHAQNVPLTGQVRTAGGKPVEFATVLLLQASDSSLVKGSPADVEGNYTFETKPGTYRVSAQQLGYQKIVSVPFTITADQTAVTAPLLLLPETTQTLNAVTVTAKKPFIEQLADRVVINVASSAVSAGVTALDVLERSPGVLVDAQNGRISLKGRDGMVMIDGKPTYLSAQEVVNLLQNTPSANVQTIELITNPSATYDAAGNAGIINIRLKRGNRTNQQTNGSVTLGAGYGQLPKTSAGLLLNHRPNNCNLFGNYDYDYRPGISRIDVQRQFSHTAVRRTVIR